MENHDATVMAILIEKSFTNAAFFKYGNGAMRDAGNVRTL